MEDGKPQVSTQLGVSGQFTLSGPVPEIIFRFPFIPNALEMGTSLWFSAGPIGGNGNFLFGTGIAPSIKYQFYSNKGFYMALDFQIELMLVYISKLVTTFNFASTLLLTYELFDWLSITVAPKIKYFTAAELLLLGGIVSLDFGNDFGVIPEFGVFDGNFTKFNIHSTEYYVGLSLRFDSKPAAKKL